MAVHKVGETLKIFPNKHPKAAPVKNEGTISPPLYPAPRVNAVKIILKIKSKKFHKMKKILLKNIKILKMIMMI